MLVGHTSDLHGWLEPLRKRPRDPDLWIWTGDMLPEDPSRKPKGQPAVQHSWIVKHGPEFKSFFGDKPVLVVDGNHDWIQPASFLRAAGVDAREVTLAKQEVFGFTYAGFPNIPLIKTGLSMIEGLWMHETTETGLQAIVEKLFEDPPQLLITHSPAAGILDSSGHTHYGIDSLRSKLEYSVHPIRYHFFGHVHEAAGLDTKMEIVFSNAARTVNYIEVKTS